MVRTAQTVVFACTSLSARAHLQNHDETLSQSLIRVHVVRACDEYLLTMAHVHETQTQHMDTFGRKPWMHGSACMCIY